MKSNIYWEQRKIQDAFNVFQKAEDTADQIAKLYMKASRYLTTQADEVFEKFQTKHKLSEAEAMRLINTLQDKSSLDELLQKLRNGEDDKKELLKQLEAPAYQARLERLRQIQNQLDYVMRNVYQQEKDFSTSFYTDLANESYYRGIYNIQQRADAAFSFSHVSAKAIDQVVNSRWSGKNYSKRIWKNTQALAQDLKEELLINLVTGRTNWETAEIISNKFGQEASNARRLVRTESNYIFTEMNFKAYEECKIDEYQYLATLDLKTSLICRKLDGIIYLVKNRMTGVNCPPMHPWCRSTTISVIGRDLIDKMQRSAIDPATGKRIKVPRSMNYQEWYNKYVKGKPDVELEEKKIKNRSSDRIQHQKYRKILGNDITKKLDDFQNMKYNETERWKVIKEAYRDVNWQREALQKHTVGESHSTPFDGSQNSVYDNFKNGQLVQRRFYGKTGKPRLDIDMTDHGNSKLHPVVPHRHGWAELQNGGTKRSEVHDEALRLGDRIANQDILKGGIRNGNTESGL